MTLRLDLETVSAVDLRRTGVYRYAEDPTTDVILACFKDADAPTAPIRTWRPGNAVPARISVAVASGETITAWNAQFESSLWAGVLAPRYGWPTPSHDQFDCTMARAMYWGYPGSLDATGAAMKLGTVKDKAGHALMMRMCRPRGYDANGKPIWWHETDPVKYDELNRYCEQDVRAEDAIAANLPPLPDTERKLWLLDQKMNRRGMPVDMGLVEDMERIVRKTEASLKQRMSDITAGAVSGPNATAALSKWCAAQGVPVPNLQKDTLKDLLRTLPDCPVKEALQIRADGAKASVSKLRAFQEAVCEDSHVRGMLRYFGASRTGRWSGAGGAKVQPHNIVRGSIKRPDQAIELIESGADPDELEFLFEDSAMGVVSSCLRGIFSC